MKMGPYLSGFTIAILYRNQSEYEKIEVSFYSLIVPTEHIEKTSW